mgnify:FL=1
MDYQLTDEQRMIVQSARAFVEQELRPYEAETDQAGEVSAELGAQIKKKAQEMGTQLRR